MSARRIGRAAAAAGGADVATKTRFYERGSAFCSCRNVYRRYFSTVPFIYRGLRTAETGEASANDIRVCAEVIMHIVGYVCLPAMWVVSRIYV